MRVGLVVYDDLDATSGGFLYDRELVAYFRDRGDEVDVRSLPRRTYGRHLLDNLSPRVPRRLRGSHDVLLQDELCHPSLVLANRLPGPDAPVVSLVHSARTAETASSPWNPLFRGIERSYLRTVDGVVATSRATAETVADLVDVPTAVVRPGRGHRSPDVSPDAIAERARGDPLRIVFVGNLLPRKGVHVLLDGLSRLPSGSWELAVVGSPSAVPRYAARLSERIDRLGLAEAVTMTGRLSDAELAALLRRQHLLAVPSTYEAFGIAYLEGMGFGLPALATTAGGADELVADGENGLLVPPDDPGAIARAVGPLLDDRDRLRELSLAARETYEAHHSWAEVGRRIRAFLDRIVGEAGDRSG